MYHKITLLKVATRKETEGREEENYSHANGRAWDGGVYVSAFIDFQFMNS